LASVLGLPELLIVKLAGKEPARLTDRAGSVSDKNLLQRHMAIDQGWAYVCREQSVAPKNRSRNSHQADSTRTLSMKPDWIASQCDVHARQRHRYRAATVKGRLRSHGSELGVSGDDVPDCVSPPEAMSPRYRMMSRASSQSCYMCRVDLPARTVMQNFYIFHFAAVMPDIGLPEVRLNC
jgi:hypothetical protein